MRNKVEITGVNTLELKVLPPEETMMLIKESQMVIMRLEID